METGEEPESQEMAVVLHEVSQVYDTAACVQDVTCMLLSLSRIRSTTLLLRKFMDLKSR